MKNVWLIFTILIFAGTLLTGCKTKKSGDREFIPGKGWVPISGIESKPSSQV
jgi:hypothetical protein